MVYRQLTCPNQEALTLATVEGYRGRSPKGPMKVEITPACLAAGIGMPLAYFEELQTSIREKVAHHMSLQPHEQAHHSAVMMLERAFDVHVPRSAEPLVVRRIFTIKARADYQKVLNGWTDPSTGIHVTPDQFNDLLRTVGAKPPTMDPSGSALTCYGILWEQNNQVCRNCDLNTACKTEASNVGLTDVALSPKLLPARAKVRTATVSSSTVVEEAETGEAVVAPKAAPVQKVVPPPITTSSVADEELLHYVEENFRGFYFHGNRYYTHKSNSTSGTGSAYLFWLGHVPAPSGPVRLRFCKPSVKLKEKLEKVGNSYYLPVGVEPKMLEKLTEKHADERPSK